MSQTMSAVRAPDAIWHWLEQMGTDFCQALVEHDFQAVYGMLAPELDPLGFQLYWAAEKVTGIDPCMYYHTEDNMGMFEEADGYELLEWLESAAFGSCDWEPVCGCYERAVNRTINKKTNEYQEYRRKIAKMAVKAMLRKLFGLKEEAA